MLVILLIIVIMSQYNCYLCSYLITGLKCVALYYDAFISAHLVYEIDARVI